MMKTHSIQHIAHSLTSKAILAILLMVGLLLPQAAQAAVPVANGQNLTIDEDTRIDITLSATDADGHALTYYIVSSPSYGQLLNVDRNNNNIVTANPIRYVPNKNQNGSDSLTFKASDGTSESNIAAVSITINPINDPPDLSAIRDVVFVVSESQGMVSKVYKLRGYDPDGDPITYTPLALPQGATLSYSGELSLTYSYENRGTYNFKFSASDGLLTAPAKDISIIVKEPRIYYVDADGVGEDGILGTADDVVSSDMNSGLAKQPWKTLSRAYTWYSGTGPKVQEGDTVFFRNGNYGIFREHTNYDGTKYLLYRDNWITYAAQPGSTAVLEKISIQNYDKSKGFGNGSSYLNFKGMRIQQGIEITYTSHVQVEDCDITGANDSLAGFHAPYNKPNASGVSILYSRNILAQGNKISFCYRGISLGSTSSDIIIRNNTIHRIGEDGMSLSAANLLVEDNLIYDLLPERTTVNFYGTRQGAFTVGDEVILKGTGARGTVYGVLTNYLQIYQTTEASFHALWNAKAGDVLIDLTSGASIPDITDVDHTHTDGFQIMPGTLNATIQRNRIIRTYMGGEDGQGFKLDGPTGTNFINNLIVATGGAGSIITCTEDLNVNSNTITGELRIFGGHSAATNRNTVVSNMYNNIIGRVSYEGDYVWHAGQPDERTYTIEVLNHGNNIFGNNPNGAPGPAHYFYVDSTERVKVGINDLFADPLNVNYNLKLNSLAVDFANPALAPSTDILGNPRDARPDAGCYEYSPEAAEVLYGDADNSGEVKIDDAAMVAKFVVKIAVPGINLLAADVNGDGSVKIDDAALIAKKVVGLITEFSAEQK